MTFDVDSLTKSLAQYSPIANDAVNLIVKAIRPLGYILISVFFLLEMLSWHQLLKREGGGLTPKLWLEIGLKYLLAYIFVWQSTTMFRAILEIFNTVTNIANHSVSAGKFTSGFDVGKSRGIVKKILSLIGNGIYYAGNLIASLLIMLRFFQMYILKAIAPIMVAFYMQDSLKPIAFNFAKQFCGYALQGLILIILVKIYPALLTDELLNAGSDVGVLTTAFMSIAKGIIYIALLVGSGRLAHKLMGV